VIKPLLPLEASIRGRNATYGDRRYTVSSSTGPEKHPGWKPGSASAKEELDQPSGENTSFFCSDRFADRHPDPRCRGLGGRDPASGSGAPRTGLGKPHPPPVPRRSPAVGDRVEESLGCSLPARDRHPCPGAAGDRGSTGGDRLSSRGRVLPGGGDLRSSRSIHPPRRRIPSRNLPADGTRWFSSASAPSPGPRPLRERAPFQSKGTRRRIGALLRRYPLHRD